MNERPKIKLELTTTDKIFEILGWLFIFAIWILIIIVYSNLPNTIPIHYNGKGQADGFGEKSNIVWMPLIATFLFIGMTYLNKFPYIFNYPTTITPDNALKQYTNSTRLIRFLKIMIIVIFGISTIQTIRDAKGLTQGLGIWFLPFIFGLIFIPIIYFVRKSIKNK